MKTATSQARVVLAAMTLAVLLVLAWTLATPANAQEEAASEDKDASDKSEQSLQGSGQKAEGGDAQSAATATESLQGADALIIEDDSNADRTVDRIEIDAAGCEVEKGADVTVEDENNERATFTNAPDEGSRDAEGVEATIESEPDLVIIEVTDDANLAPGFGPNEADEVGSVASSTNTTCGRANGGDSEGDNGSETGGEQANEAAGQNSSNDGNCEDAKVVERLSGTGDQQSPRFSTTGNSFRVTSDVDAADERPFLYSVTVNDENGDFVTSISQEREGTNASFVNADAGTYFLDIPSLFAEYTVTVEDCAGVGSNGNGGDIVNDPGGNLPNTGGLSLLGLAVLGVVSAAAGLAVIRGGRR